MPTTDIHFGFNAIVYYLISVLFSVEFIFFNLIYLLLAELIDIDHLFSRPIYVKKRDPFKTHFFHKNFIFVSLFAVLIMFISAPFIFVGLGLLSHLSLDFIYTKYVLKI